MSENEGPDYKRLRILDMLLMIGSNNKLIIKALDNEKEHLTMKSIGDVLDVHKTTEGTIKEYETVGHYDFGRQGKNLWEEVLLPSVSVLDLSDPRFEDVSICIRNTDEDLLKPFSKIVKDELKITPEALLAVANAYTEIKPEDVPKHNFNFGLVSKNNTVIGAIQRVQDCFIFIDLEKSISLMDAFMESFRIR